MLRGNKGKTRTTTKKELPANTPSENRVGVLEQKSEALPRKRTKMRQRIKHNGKMESGICNFHKITNEIRKNSGLRSSFRSATIPSNREHLQGLNYAVSP